MLDSVSKVYSPCAGLPHYSIRVSCDILLDPKATDLAGRYIHIDLYKIRGFLESILTKASTQVTCLASISGRTSGIPLTISKLLQVLWRCNEFVSRDISAFQNPQRCSHIDEEPVIQ